MPQLRRCGNWVAIVGMVVALYVGAYYWMVVPIPDWTSWSTGKVAFYSGFGASPILVESDEQKFRNRVFTPIHWLDRRLRPHVWEP